MANRQKPTIQWQTSVRERNSYLVYFTGQNMFYQLIAAFLTTYLMMTGMDMIKAGTIVMAVKVWDAVNDALFGAIFDKVKFKSGNKCLPWIRVSTVLIPLASILLFAIPTGSSESVKLAWFAIAYLLWDTAYTICDVPIYTMVTTITSDLAERNLLMARRPILAGIGMGITTIAFTILPSESVGLNYTLTTVIVSVLAAITMIPIGIYGKERNYHAGDRDETFTLRQMFSYLGKNKYLLFYYGGFIVANALLTNNTLSLIASYYLFGNSMFNLLIGALSMAPQFIIALFLPAILRRIDKFKFYVYNNIATIILGLAIFFVGYENVVGFLILTIIRSIPASVIGVMNFMFTPDCAEYGQYKTGTDAKGITFAVQTFSAKITSAIASSLGMLLLGFFHWQEVTASSFEELQALGVSQTPEALHGLWITYALVPVLGYIAALVMYAFYKLNDKDVQIMAQCNAGEITREQAQQLLSRKY